jgi:hypothetical protein
LVYLLVFYTYINEMRGSRSKILSIKSRPYIYDVKFLALLGAPNIYDIIRLRVKAYDLLDVPPALTFRNSVLYPHSVLMCFAWISQQTTINSLFAINWLVFITETESLLHGTNFFFDSNRYNFVLKCLKRELKFQEEGFVKERGYRGRLLVEPNGSMGTMLSRNVCNQIPTHAA